MQFTKLHRAEINITDVDILIEIKLPVTAKTNLNCKSRVKINKRSPPLTNEDPTRHQIRETGRRSECCWESHCLQNLRHTAD